MNQLFYIFVILLMASSNHRQSSVNNSLFITILLLIGMGSNIHIRYKFLILAATFSMIELRAPILLTLNLLSIPVIGVDKYRLNSITMYRKCFDIVETGFKFSTYDQSNPVIIMCNYPHNIHEYGLLNLLGDVKRPICVVVSKQVCNLRALLPGVKLITVDIRSKHGYADAKEQAIKMINDGYDIHVYPEKWKTRTDSYATSSIRSGFFHISKELGVPIMPCVISHIDLSMNCVIRGTPIYIHTEKPRVVECVDTETQRVHDTFATQLALFRRRLDPRWSRIGS